MTGINIGDNVEARNVQVDQRVNVFNPGDGTMNLGDENLFSSEDQAFFNNAQNQNFK